MRLTLTLTLASLKMFFRQREALLWSLLLPLFMILLFSFVKFDGIGKITVGIVNGAGERGTALISAFGDVKTLRIVEGEEIGEREQLEKGERDLVLLIPPSFSGMSGAELTALTNDAKPRESQLGLLVLQRILDERTFRQSPVAGRVVVTAQPVKSRNLTYIDFLLPGVLSMSIMQMGIFGVAFGFVSLKKRGILRRLWATPIRPSNFIIAQVAMRLFVVMLQVTLMVGAGLLFFDLHLIGSIANMFVIALLGAIVFLGIGFTLAGISRSEDQVAPLANVITLPMLLLSGIFFSRSSLPGFISTITSFFPLTYLADGMRSIAIDGASLVDVGPQLLGLLVWCVVSCAVAIRFFRWE